MHEGPEFRTRLIEDGVKRLNLTLCFIILSGVGEDSIDWITGSYKVDEGGSSGVLLERKRKAFNHEDCISSAQSYLLLGYFCTCLHKRLREYCIENIFRNSRWHNKFRCTFFYFTKRLGNRMGPGLKGAGGANSQH